MIEEHIVETPAWIRALVQELRECITSHAFTGALGFRYEYDDDEEIWRISAYPTPTELCGPGPADGALCVGGVSVNVGRFMDSLSDVNILVWHAPAPMAGPAEMTAEGRFANKRFCLQFSCMPPRDEPPATVLDIRTGKITKLDS